MTKNNQGMSLIELLLALSIGAVVMVLVYGFLHTTNIFEDRRQESSQSIGLMRLALNTVQTDLLRLVDYNFAGSYPQRQAFQATERRMEFVAQTPLGLRVIVYEIGRPNWGSQHTTIIAAHSQKIKHVLETTTTDNRVFLLRGEESLDAVLSDNKTVVADQILVGPFDPEMLTWAMISEENGRITKSPQWSAHEMPKGVEWTVNMPKWREGDKPTTAMMITSLTAGT